MPPRLVPDSFDYRLARAKLRAASGSAEDAVAYFRNQLADHTVLRAREDVYGLALALRRLREFAAAEKELATIRSGEGNHPAFEWLAAQLQADQGRTDAALETYRTALSRPSRSIAGSSTAMRSCCWRPAGRTRPSPGSRSRVRATPDDAKLYELQSRAFAAAGKRVAQHRAQAEAYYRRGNLAAAVGQLEIATKERGSDFYELSITDARLRELRNQLENEREAEKALKLG